MIKLKEELKTINSNKLNKIKKIAKEIRAELETAYDWESNRGCFGKMCYNVSKELVKKLKENGIYAYTANGMYLGASYDYTPDMEDWDSDDVNEYYENQEDYAKNIGFTHWWVVADNKWIVDITSDQFHPNDEDDYRIVITNISDEDYSS